MSKDNLEAKKSMNKERVRKLLFGLNTWVSILLACAVLVLVNRISLNYYLRGDFSKAGFYCLSDKTVGLLENISKEVSIVVFMEKNHDFSKEVRNLLKEYVYSADKLKSFSLTVDIVDPNRDLARARELGSKYKVASANVIVFECEGREKLIEIDDMIDYEVDYSQMITTRRIVKSKVGFKGEQVISSAIQNVVQSSKPVVYFLQGHGERSNEDFSEVYGFSSAAQALKHDNIEVKSLLLAEGGGIPQDCSLLIIAGADRAFSPVEVDNIAGYLDKNGRVFILIDPGVVTGLEPLLSRWGVKLADDAVFDPRKTLTGADLVVTTYGNHVLMRKLKNAATIFYECRSVEPVEIQDPSEEVDADKPSVSILAATSAEGFADYGWRESTIQFDEDVDRKGHISVAVAVEKGMVRGIDVEIKPTRIIVVGDSDFVSNRGLSGGVGGNLDFFVSAVNWLVEREFLMGIAPKGIKAPELGMTREKRDSAFFVIVMSVPGVIALLGLVVWWWRRR